MASRTYGYRQLKGQIRIIEEEALKIQKLYMGYLIGLTQAKAAQEAGIKASHTTILNYLRNERYIGTEGFPPIIDEDTFRRVQQMRERRHLSGSMEDAYDVPMEFTMKRSTKEYKDPIRMTEYLYGLIEVKQ